MNSNIVPVFLSQTLKDEKIVLSKVFKLRYFCIPDVLKFRLEEVVEPLDVLGWSHRGQERHDQGAVHDRYEGGKHHHEAGEAPLGEALGRFQLWVKALAEADSGDVNK